MKDLLQLQTEATDAAYQRDHAMRWFPPYHSESQSVQTGQCIYCKKEAQLVMNPGPEQVEIKGEAVTLQCDKPACPSCGERLLAHSPSLGCPYNGWPNYETWLVNLWLDNEEAWYRDTKRMTRGSDIKAYVEQLVEGIIGEKAAREGLVSDIISTFLSDVEFNRIGEHHEADTEDNEGDENNE